MRTTINERVGRRGDARVHEEAEGLLNAARKLLADTSAMLELELDRLFEIEVDDTDKDRIKQINELIRSTQKAMQTVLDIELKYGLDVPGLGDGEIDLEAAREEILGRLARLAA